MKNILKLLKTKDYFFMAFSLLFIVTQVWLDLKMPDYMNIITTELQQGGNVNVILRNGGMMLLFLLMLVSGVCVAANNKLNLYLSGVIDSVIFFPVVNGGGLVLTTLASLIIFKERLRTKQWIGILLGIASVLCICVG